MSLILQYEAVLSLSDPRRILLRDNTGMYSETHPGGYSGPNPAKTDLYLTAHIHIERSNGNSTIPVIHSSLVGYDFQATLTHGGLIHVAIQASLRYEPHTYTYQTGKIYWHPTANSYVRITQVFPDKPALFQPVSSSTLTQTDYLAVCTLTHYAALEVEQTLAKEIETLLIIPTCDYSDWIEKITVTQKDAQAIQLLACQEQYEKANLILARYQHFSPVGCPHP